LIYIDTNKGILFVLFFYAVVLTTAGVAGAVIMGGAAKRLIPHPGLRRKQAVAAAAVFPFACVGYMGVWFVAYAVINDVCFQRDPGLGDSWYTPLPNGYALLMIDTTDQGTVYNPKTQPTGGAVISRDGSLSGVRQLQVAGDLILGARDTGYFERLGEESNAVDSYFELNTKTMSHKEYGSLTRLQEQAAAEGVRLHLLPFFQVFSQYRTSWFDYVSGLMLVLLPLLGFCLLGRWIWKIRRDNLAAQNTR
jgi:hypothetical protein